MGDRLDLVVKDKYNFSREYAKEIIFKGYVLVDSKVVYKPSFKIDDKDSIEILENAYPKYVSRGGFKLEKAITTFNINLEDKKCMDIGASTGGFSDCMLQSGAKLVYAIDVGTSQLNSTILENDKIISLENTDIRTFELDQKFDFISIDVSFISIIKILDKIKYFLNENGEAIILIKPQFEVGKDNIDRNGIVKNKNLHIKTIENIVSACQERELFIKGITYSPIKGSKGNIEYLLYIGKKISKNNIKYYFKNIVFEAFENLK